MRDVKKVNRSDRQPGGFLLLQLGEGNRPGAGLLPVGRGKLLEQLLAFALIFVGTRTTILMYMSPRRLGLCSSGIPSPLQPKDRAVLRAGRARSRGRSCSSRVGTTISAPRAACVMEMGMAQ